MSLEAFYRGLKVDESLAATVGFNPYYPSLESGLDDPLTIAGRPVINLAANNYLGLAADERVKKAVMAGVEKYGASLCGTPIATGAIDLFRALEQRLAAFVGLEDAVLLPSGYQANTGIFPAIAGRDDVIVIDHFAHSSLIQGARAVGCKIRPFLHNDPAHLEKILVQLKGFRQVFVVTESVFSTEGSIAPVRDIVDVCHRFQALPVIDDSHGIGVIGSSGRGILEHGGLKQFPGLYTASLGKALANAGGVIAGNRTAIAHLRYYCPHLVYSTALTPGPLAGVAKVLDIIATEFPDLSRRLGEHRNRLRTALTKAGLPLSPGEAPINAILAGTPEQTLLLARVFFEQGILTTPFIAPSVPQNEGRVRLIAGADLGRETLDRVIARLPAIADQFRALEKTLRSS